MPRAFKKRNVEGVIYTEKLFLPGGEVNTWTEEVRRTWQNRARAAAPVNKRPSKNPQTANNPYGGTPRGTLVRRIGMRKRVVSGHQIEIEGRSNAPYSLFVHEGVKGPILATQQFRQFKNGRFTKGGMYLPRNGYRTRRYNAVDGQKPNRFMTRSLDKTWRAKRIRVR